MSKAERNQVILRMQTKLRQVCAAQNKSIKPKRYWVKTQRRFLPMAAGLLFISSSCFADGNALLKYCAATEVYLDTEKVTDEFGIGMCLGMVQGVRNTMQVMGVHGPIKACLPESGIDNGQATRVVLSYLRKNSDSLHWDGPFLIMGAFIDAYPCD